jgi:Na+-translocating ferredoxin:NAD+ oxidoreductase RnfG subunit
MQRRTFIQGLAIAFASLSLTSKVSFAKRYFTIEQAQKILWKDAQLTHFPLELTEQQAESIAKASDIRVRNLKINAWRSEDKGWFIVDQVIGKHENIDLAVAIDNQGKVMGLEVLTYRETYGDQIMHPKWRAQFHGRDSSEYLKLDQQIKNISGATLSCRHVTDGINRLNHTWDQVLRLL